MRREIKAAGAEDALRAEVCKAIEEATSELAPSIGGELAATAAVTYLPRFIASAVLLGVRMQEMEAARQSLYAAIAQPLPDDAAPETRVLVRIARQRVDALTQYPNPRGL